MSQNFNFDSSLDEPLIVLNINARTIVDVQFDRLRLKVPAK